MAKDPAFLFYPGDWISGTMYMTFEEKGAYMELLMYQFNRGFFSDDVVKRMLNVRYDAVWSAIKDKFILNQDGYYNERLRFEIEKRKKYTESRRESRLKSDEDNVKLYLIKDKETGYYKIGSSVNPLRRYAEMCNQKSPAIVVGNRDYELVWQSGIVKRTEESELHKHFDNKRITGEWFNLTDGEVEYIKKRYLFTYVKRTENENENRNSIKKGSLRENKKVRGVSFSEDGLKVIFPDGSTQELGQGQRLRYKEGNYQPYYVYQGIIE